MDAERTSSPLSSINQDRSKLSIVCRALLGLSSVLAVLALCVPIHATALTADEQAASEYGYNDSAVSGTTRRSYVTPPTADSAGASQGTYSASPRRIPAPVSSVGGSSSSEYGYNDSAVTGTTRGSYVTQSTANSYSASGYNDSSSSGGSGTSAGPSDGTNGGSNSNSSGATSGTSDRDRMNAQKDAPSDFQKDLTKTTADCDPAIRDLEARASQVAYDNYLPLALRAYKPPKAIYDEFCIKLIANFYGILEWISVGLNVIYMAIKALIEEMLREVCNLALRFVQGLMNKYLCIPIWRFWEDVLQWINGLNVDFGDNPGRCDGWSPVTVGPGKPLPVPNLSIQPVTPEGLRRILGLENVDIPGQPSGTGRASGTSGTTPGADPRYFQ